MDTDFCVLNVKPLICITIFPDWRKMGMGEIMEFQLYVYVPHTIPVLYIRDSLDVF